MPCNRVNTNIMKGKKCYNCLDTKNINTRLKLTILELGFLNAEVWLRL